MSGRVHRAAGITLIEIVIVVAIAGALLAAGGAVFSSWSTDQRVKAAARSVADLMTLARSEAIRSRLNHVLVFDLDAGGSGLVHPDGGSLEALVFADANGDGNPQSTEYVASLATGATQGLGWGSVFALTQSPEVPTPNDNPGATYPLAAGFECCSFTQPGGAVARWIAFLPDGTPRGFSLGPVAIGAVGTGSGSVYLTNGSRDYAVVLSALGAVRVHVWNPVQGAWRQ
jgi:Tfp pilus assembly protein FimT